MTKDTELEQYVAATMRAVANAIDEFVKEHHSEQMGWFVAMFPLNDHGTGRFNYISNANRQDIITLLKEMVARFEGMPEVPPTRA